MSYPYVLGSSAGVVSARYFLKSNLYWSDEGRSFLRREFNILFISFDTVYQSGACSTSKPLALMSMPHSIRFNATFSPQDYNRIVKGIASVPIRSLSTIWVYSMIRRMDQLKMAIVSSQA